MRSGVRFLCVTWKGCNYIEVNYLKELTELRGWHQEQVLELDGVTGEEEMFNFHRRAVKCLDVSLDVMLATFTNFKI